MASDLLFHKMVNLEKSIRGLVFSHFFNILAGTPKITLFGQMGQETAGSAKEMLWETAE